MLRLILAVLIATPGLLPCDALSQPGEPQAQRAPERRELLVAPNAPEQKPEAVLQDGSQVKSAGQPANICQELVAFLGQRTPNQGAPAAAGNQPRPNAPSPSPAQERGTAGPGQTAPPVDRAQQQSGQSAPIPPDDKPDKAVPPASLEQAQSLAAANDLRGCQRAAQQMRRAGVALPPGLIALAALREDLLMGAHGR